MSQREAAAASAASKPTPGKLARLPEQTKVVLLVGGALGLGGFLQFFVEPGPQALVVAAAIAGLATFVAAQVMPGRWREVLAGFRFTSVLLIVLGLAAALGTLILQGRPLSEYPVKYGPVAGEIIVQLRLDDIFHSLWFACLMALFGAGVVNSALLRWPLKLRNLGFFTCHVGLIMSLVGAGLSAYFAVRGRVELFADGSTVGSVYVTKGGQVKVAGYDRAGNPIPASAPLGFDLRLDQFDLVRYETEWRVAYYEPKVLPDGRAEWRIKASFDPEPGVKHLLPGGNSFTLATLWTDYQAANPAANVATGKDASHAALRNPAAVLQVKVDGVTTQTAPLFGEKNVVPVPPNAREPRGYLAFERREEEAKSYQSHVTALTKSGEHKALVKVNDPFSFGGWTFYQVNYDPKNPRYSGLEAVHDPGVNWVFMGFALIIAGVFYMFYVETRLKAKKAAAPPAAERAVRAAA